MAKYCANCGKELTDEQDICLNCEPYVLMSHSSHFPILHNEVAIRPCSQ